MKNTNGQGSISYEKERKTYRAAIVDTQGKRIRKRFNTKQEAEEWLTVVRAEFINSTYVAKSSYTVGEWLLEYLNTYAKQKVKPTTFSRYKNSVTHFNEIADTNISELSSIMLQKFLNNHFKDIPSARAHAYAVFNSAMTKAKKLGVIKNNPCEDVYVKKPNPREVTVFTKEELAKLLEFVKTNRYYKRYYVMILTASLTGMRIGEVCALQWDCVFPSFIRVKSTLTVINGKQYLGKPKSKKSERDITIPAFLYDLLSKLPHTCEYVFPTRTNRGITPTNFDSVTWPRLMKASGIPFRNFHTLRHTHATLLLANGVGIADVSKRLGHSKISTTLDTYTHFIPDYDKTLPDKIAAIYGVAPTLPPV